MPLDQRARQIFDYFQKYNYEVRFVFNSAFSTFVLGCGFP